MSHQTRSVPVEEVQKIQKSLWRQSSAAKEAIRDAASRVLEHVRSRETFLLEQVELLERAKFELLLENAETDEASINEVILEFASMALGVEAGLRTLCDAIANFGPEFGQDAKTSLRKRCESGGSSLDSDFCVLDDESVNGQQTPAVAPADEEEEEEAVSSRCLFAFLENSPISEWLLDADAEAEDRVVGFFGESSRYALDHAYWLKETEIEEEAEENEEEQDGWEKWLHPTSASASNGADEAFFSEYMQFLRQSSHEEWMKEAQIAAPAAAPVLPAAAPVATASAAASIAAPVISPLRTDASETPVVSTESTASTTSSRKASIKEPSYTESWLMSTPLAWHNHHPHHYGECVESCRAMPDNIAQMEIENLGNLSCLQDNPVNTLDGEEEHSQWILKPKKGKIVSGKSRKNQQMMAASASEWLLKAASAASESSSAAPKKDRFDVTEWLKTSEKELVKGLCKANEPCSGFERCLSDINCKKSRKTDDEEKEKEDEKKEKESSDDWVMPKKPTFNSSTAMVKEEKVNQFMRNYQVMSQDFWLTS